MIRPPEVEGLPQVRFARLRRGSRVGITPLYGHREAQDDGGEMDELQMASLKDMRVRIAATKATQKITKAMQMVAASKLRRAQAAAEAARPYAEHMDAVLRNIAGSVKGLDAAPALLRGTGSDRVHLLVVCTAERGLCGPFNSAIVRLAREHINRLIADGKEVKIFCVGKKGYEQLRRQYEKQIVERVELRGGAHARAWSMPRRSRSRSPHCTSRARSTSARCSSRAFGR